MCPQPVVLILTPQFLQCGCISDDGVGDDVVGDTDLFETIEKQQESGPNTANLISKVL